MNETSTALIESHREYVRKLARQVQRSLPKSVQFDDLVGYGELGLVEAASKYDPMSGAAFTTFAYLRIRGAIFDGLSKMTGLTPSIRAKLQQEAAMDQVAEQSATELGASGREPTPQAAAETMSKAIGGLGVVYLMSQQAEDQRPAEPADESDPSESIVQRELSDKLKQVIATLEPEDADLVERFYFKQQSMTDIAAEMGVNKATVSRRHAKVIDALREAMAA